VAKAQVCPTQTALQALGYRLSPLCGDPRPGFRERFANEVMFEPSGSRRLSIDLHWELWSGAGFYRLPFSHLAASAPQIDFHGIPAQVLSPEHTVIHLALHLFEDFYGVIQMVDLLDFLGASDVDWRVFQEEVEQFHCQGPVGLVLHRVAALAPGLLPPAVLADLAAYRPTLLENLILTRKLGYITGYLPLLRHYSVGSRLFYLAAKLWPDRQYLTQSLRVPGRAAYLRQFLQKVF